MTATMLDAHRAETATGPAAAGPPVAVEDKVYVGRRRTGYWFRGRVAVVVVNNGAERPLEHRVLHSPTGFEWGYVGSGPADLARSLLWDYLGFEPPPKLAQHYKSAVVAFLPYDGWDLPASHIAAWLDMHGHEGRR